MDGAVLEQRLRAYFDGENPSESDTTRPAVLWHSTIDLLTVRYFEMTSQTDDVIRRDNSKDYQGKYQRILQLPESSGDESE